MRAWRTATVSFLNPVRRGSLHLFELHLRCLGILPCRLTHRRQHFSQPQDLPRTIIRATTRARATIRLLSGRQTVLWMEIKGSRLVGSWLRLPSLRSYMFAIPSPSSAPISHGQRSLVIRARACVQQTGSSWQMKIAGSSSLTCSYAVSPCASSSEAS
jgi:hypothetical protein